MPTALFPLRLLQISLFILLIGLLITCYHRTEHFDDAWFAEQSYWLVQDGQVRSELFRGLNGWENRIYVFHKLFIYAGALIMSGLGFSLTASKLLTTLCAVVTGYLIWQYNSRASKQQQWVAVILYFGCGTIIRYFAINRPEMMCMALGFGSYLALDRPDNQAPKAWLAGILAGLAALTHLNGVVYLVVGAIWLLIRFGWSPAFWFSLLGGLTLGLYGIDALTDGHLPMMINQFINDPATQSNFRLTDKLIVMLNYHQLFFHSHGEIPLSALCLVCLLLFRKRVRIFQPVLLYFVLLFFSFWLLTKSNFDFYYILFVPWLLLIVAELLTVYLPTSPVWQQRVGKGALLVYYAFALFCIGKVLVENYTVPYVTTYNKLLAQHMPLRQTKIIAPISFFFGQIDHYKIRGLSYYFLLHRQAPLNEFFQLADREHAHYVVSDGYLTASYVIPLDAPAHIGPYKRIFQDDMTSIYEHQ